MAANRTTLENTWVKLADAGSFLIHNSGAYSIDIAITDTPPTTLANAFTLPAFSSLPMSDFQEDIYGRGPGIVVLLGVPA